VGIVVFGGCLNLLFSFMVCNIVASLMLLCGREYVAVLCSVLVFYDLLRLC